MGRELQRLNGKSGGHCSDAANQEGECCMNKFAARITGKIVPAVPVPWSADGRIHRAAQESYVRYMASQDVGGSRSMGTYWPRPSPRQRYSA